MIVPGRSLHFRIPSCKNGMGLGEIPKIFL